MWLPKLKLWTIDVRQLQTADAAGQGQPRLRTSQPHKLRLRAVLIWSWSRLHSFYCHRCCQWSLLQLCCWPLCLSRPDRTFRCRTRWAGCVGQQLSLVAAALTRKRCDCLQLLQGIKFWLAPSVEEVSAILPRQFKRSKKSTVDAVRVVVGTHCVRAIVEQNVCFRRPSHVVWLLRPAKPTVGRIACGSRETVGQEGRSCFARPAHQGIAI